MSLLTKAPDRADAVELRIALDAVQARLLELYRGATDDEEPLSQLVVSAAAGEFGAEGQLSKLKRQIADRNSEIDDLERASRKLGDDLLAAQKNAENALRVSWDAIERKLLKRRKCAIALERALHEAAELWRRYDRLGQQAFAAVPIASRDDSYTYLQPAARGSIIGDYTLAKALASAGIGIAPGTHLPSENDLAEWEGLAAVADDFGRRLLALRGASGCAIP